MLNDRQQRNYNFFKEHLSEYLTNPLLVGKFGVFFDGRLVKAFDDFEGAVKFAVSEFEDGAVVQEIIDESALVNYNRWLEVGYA